MDVKPDPKPGRWILPLVIVAMVGFTYVFVNSIQDSADGSGDGDGGVDIGGSTSTSMPVIDTTTPGGDDGGEELDPDTQAYVDTVTAFSADLEPIVADLVAANTAWDEETATYTDTVAAFEAVIDSLGAWSGEVASSNAPASRADLTEPHQAVKDAAAAPLDDARAALGFLESSETGSADGRRQSVADLEASAQAFYDAVDASLAIARG
jgi:hypothetical protein